MNYFYPQQQQQYYQQQQTNGFVSVRNELEARNYPVAYGNSVTFKDENAPYVYTKTMGFSQLEMPRFEKYRLVKEEPQEAQTGALSCDTDNLYSKDEIKAIWDEIEALKGTIAKLMPAKKRKETAEDE